MTIVTTTAPTAPGDGDLVQFSSVGTGKSIQATSFLYDLRSVPAGSALTLGMLTDSVGNPTSSFTPDIAGTYSFNIYSYSESFGAASFAGDSRGVAQSRLLETHAQDVLIGQVWTLPIVTTRGSGATLRLVIFTTTDPMVDATSTVVAATLINPTDKVAEQAINDSTVISALGALVGVLASGIDADFVLDVQEIGTKYQAHRVNTGGGTPVHQAADTVDVLTAIPYSVDAAIGSLNEIINAFSAHEANQTAHSHADTKNLMLVPKSVALAGSIVSKAELRRIYAAHLAQTANPGSHAFADGTNTLSAPLALPSLIAAFVGFIATRPPAPPVGFVPI